MLKQLTIGIPPFPLAISRGGNSTANKVNVSENPLCADPDVMNRDYCESFATAGAL